PWLIRFSLAARRQRVEAIADALRALHSQVFDCYAPLLKNAGAEALIRRTGVLYVYESKAGFDGSLGEVEMRRRRGVQVDLLGADEIRQLEPALAPKFRWGMFLPEHGHTVNPQRLVQSLGEQFRRDGGSFVQAAVRGFARADGKVSGVVTESGSIAA